MTLDIMAIGSALDPIISDPEASYSLLPSIADFDRSMTIADLPQGVAAGIGEQFSQLPAPRTRHYVFGVRDLPQTGLDRDLDLRWDGIKRLGRRVAQQYLGPGEEKVSLKGVIYPPNYGRFEILEQLRQEALRGRPRSVFTGYGRYQGLWVIKSIKDTQTHYLPGGYPRKIDFTIELMHYGGDSSLSIGGLDLNFVDTTVTNGLSGGIGVAQPTTPGDGVVA